MDAKKSLPVESTQVAEVENAARTGVLAALDQIPSGSFNEIKIEVNVYVAVGGGAQINAVDVTKKRE